MDYQLAHDLAEFAHLTKQFHLKELEWLIKKTEWLGAMRKREINLGIIASEELGLRDLEREIDEVRGRLRAAKKSLLESFRRARKAGKCSPLRHKKARRACSKHPPHASERR